MQPQLRVLILAAVLLLVGCGGGSSSTGKLPDEVPDAPPVAYTVEEVAHGFDHPWGMAFLPDGRLLVTERPGRLTILDLAANTRTEIRNLPSVRAGGQGGLLDVALHPRFAENGWVYLSYSAGDDGLSTHVGRARLEENTLVGFQRLFQATEAGRGTEHFGGRLAFDSSGYLFLGLGDRHERQRAQDLGDHNGSVIRLMDDGSVPVDNPFVGSDVAQPQIYSYGHRNVQGVAVHPVSGRLWLSEHGPQGGDELNVVSAGKNYGWPTITHGEEYGGGVIGPTHGEGLEQPVRHWTPAIAPSGILFYTGTAFPAWQGNLFVTALAGEKLVRLVLDGERIVAEDALLTSTGLRLRDVEQGPDGLIYLLVDAAEAPLLRLRAAP